MLGLLTMLSISIPIKGPTNVEGGLKKDSFHGDSQILQSGGG